MTSEQEITADMLREDAAQYRLEADMFDELDTAGAQRDRRAAAALEWRAAEALEQGERVCRWEVLYTPQGLRSTARETSCGKWRSRSSSAPIYCSDCGGRVVLGDDGEVG